MTFQALHQIARWLGCQRIDFESCASTNDEAARMARAGAKHGTVVIAERQTAGRGRDGRVWVSPSGGLYLSAVLRPALPLADVPPMTLAIGIGLCDAIRAFGAHAQLKWPNDVLVAGKKLAGVLVEAHSQGGKLESVVVGIGVNLDDTPVSVSATATAFDSPPDREAFITALLANVERWIDRYIAVGLEAIVPAWQDRMAHGIRVRATPLASHSLVGEVVGLASDGSLALRDDAGIVHHVRSGDVEVIRVAHAKLELDDDDLHAPPVSGSTSA